MSLSKIGETPITVQGSLSYYCQCKFNFYFVSKAILSAKNMHTRSLGHFYSYNIRDKYIYHLFICKSGFRTTEHSRSVFNHSCNSYLIVILSCLYIGNSSISISNFRKLLYLFYSKNLKEINVYPLFL